MSMRASVKDVGDRAWDEAGKATVDGLVKLVQKRAKKVDHSGGIDEVHDMRTAIRRLRTAIKLHADGAPKDRRGKVEDELKLVADRLGTVRDLDVLVETLDGFAEAGGSDQKADIEPLRKAWRKERARGARRLKTELDRARFRRALERTKRLVPSHDQASTDKDDGSNGKSDRVANQAPALIWDAFGEVLAYEIDPRTADPASIHKMRIAAKKLRYTLEAFEDAIEPGATLIQDVTALQDAAGAMHDAIVAGERARSTVPRRDLSKRQKRAIDAFADAQAGKAEHLRPAIAQRLATIRSRA